MSLRLFKPCLESLEVRALLDAGALDPTFAAGSRTSPLGYGVVTTQLQSGALEQGVRAEFVLAAITGSPEYCSTR